MSIWDRLNTIQNYGTQLLESTEQIAKEILPLDDPNDSNVKNQQQPGGSSNSRRKNTFLSNFIDTNDYGFTDTSLSPPTTGYKKQEEDKAVNGDQEEKSDMGDFSSNNRQLDSGAVEASRNFDASNQATAQQQFPQQVRYQEDSPQRRQQLFATPQQTQLDLASGDQVQEIEFLLKQKEEEIEELQQALVDNQLKVKTAQEQIDRMDSEISQLRVQQQLAEQLQIQLQQKDSLIQKLQNGSQAGSRKNSDLASPQQSLHSPSQWQVGSTSVSEGTVGLNVQELQHRNQQLQSTLDHLKVRAKQKIAELQAQLKQAQEQSAPVSPQQQSQNLQQVVHQKDQEIAELKEELKKASTQLQETADKNMAASNSSLSRGDLSTDEQVQKLQQKLQFKDSELVRLTADLKKFQALVAQMKKMKTRIEEQQEMLKAKDEQISMLSTQSSVSSNNQQNGVDQAALNEKNQLIDALKQQIDGLHKTNSTLPLKEEEIRSLKRSVAEYKTNLEDLQSQFAEQQEQLEERQQEINKLRDDLKYADNSQSSRLSELQLENQKLKSQIEELRAQIEELSGIQSKYSDSQADSERVRTQLENAQQKVEELQQQCQLLQQFEQNCEQLTSQVGDLKGLNSQLTSQVEELSEKLDSAEREKATAEQQLSQLQLQVDQLDSDKQSELAEYVVKCEDLQKQLSDGEFKQQQLQTRISSVEEEIQEVQRQRDDLRAELDGFGQNSAQEKEYLEQKSKSLSNQLSQQSQQLQSADQEISQLKGQIYELESQLKTLQQSGAITQNHLDRVTDDWRSKLADMEQNNMRLLDRTLRAERQLANYENESRNASAGLSRSGSNFMQGVDTFSWLQTKEEDDIDSDGADLESVSRGSLMPRGGDVMSKVKFYTRFYVRKSMRLIDRKTVQAGMYLKDNAMVRICAVGYLVFIQIYLLMKIIGL
ncbi:hypothetical protein MIR68_005207 [Amoeboaphelidium protococcarum]|nr:hypothetical protein MIR68_005207 [Amoeboaphelidium protococcarum]